MSFCPNEDDPVLCKYDQDYDRIIPEAGCPVHDPDARPRITVYQDLEQRSEAWFAARAGLITASVAGKLITPSTLQPASNQTTRDLAAQIAAERITGHCDPTSVTVDMYRGIDSERYAVEKYSEHYAPVQSCGFMVRDDWGWGIGYSPDGLVGENGLIEIKSPRQKGHLATVLAGEVPAEHIAQIQTGLLVSGREWCDFISYNGGMHMWVARVHADPKWQEAFIAAAKAFELTVAEMVTKYRAAVEGLHMTDRIDLVVI